MSIAKITALGAVMIFSQSKLHGHIAGSLLNTAAISSWIKPQPRGRLCGLYPGSRVATFRCGKALIVALPDGL
ncbi:MAG: hypothetical protein WBL55_05370 [Xanthobacteraceae bacterium]